MHAYWDQGKLFEEKDRTIKPHNIVPLICALHTLVSDSSAMVYLLGLSAQFSFLCCMRHTFVSDSSVESVFLAAAAVCLVFHLL
jgi:hypothetical protein